MGWDVVDNLPADLLQEFVHGGGQCRTANVGDRHGRAQPRLRSRNSLRDLIHSIEGVEPEILYLDCSGTELMRRYDETRRRHPLAPDRPAEDGIARERQLTLPLRTAADSLIDTTDLSPAELRDELRRRFGGDCRSAGADHRLLRLRPRHLAHRRPGVRPAVPAQSALGRRASAADRRDQPVRDYLEQEPAWGETMGRIEALLIDWIPRYWAAGKSYVTVAFGCTGGRHRSVAAAVEMAERLRRAGFAPNVRHRDLASPPRDTIERHPGRAPESEDELSR